MSFALGKVSRPNEVQISEVLALGYAFSNLDCDGVFTLLEFEAQAGVVCAYKEIIVTVQDCFVSSCPAVGCRDYLLVSGAFVDYKGCATFFLVLQTDVYCYLIDTSLLYGESEGDGVGGNTVAAVYVCIRQLAATCTDLVIFHVATGGILECIKTDSVIELFRKCCGELVYICCAVAICVELRGYVGGGELVIAVYALACFDLVSVVVIDVTTNGAYAPGLFKSCGVGESVYVVAVGFARRNLGSATNGAYAINIGVSENRNGLLSNENFAANGALLTFGKTCFGAGCCLAGNYFFGVSENRNGLLSNENFAANRALLTFGKTCLGAGCCLAGNNFFGVSNYGNDLLSYKSFAALGANLTFGKTCLGASCCLTGNYFLGMLVFGGGRFGSCYFGSGNFRSGNFGSGIFRGLTKQVTRSNREHHSNGKNHNQNAQNVLVSHIENLHKKFGALLHGNIIS